MSTAVASAGAAGTFRDYGPDGAAGGLCRSTPRRADDTNTRPSESGAGPTRQSDDRDSEPGYLLRPTMHGPGGTLLIIAHSFLAQESQFSGCGMIAKEEAAQRPLLKLPLF